MGGETVLSAGLSSETVSHVSNAIHMSDPLAHGLRKLAPGATFDAWMKLDVAGV